MTRLIGEKQPPLTSHYQNSTSHRLPRYQFARPIFGFGGPSRTFGAFFVTFDQGLLRLGPITCHFRMEKSLLTRIDRTGR
uniref:Uncharacterized protein n=1 Tax=Romanomermis culicivorax TaxID=13658 RepID=A0A915L6Z9_ROMCU